MGETKKKKKNHSVRSKFMRETYNNRVKQKLQTTNIYSKNKRKINNKQK